MHHNLNVSGLGFSATECNAQAILIALNTKSWDKLEGLCLQCFISPSQRVRYKAWESHWKLEIQHLREDDVSAPRVDMMIRNLALKG